MASPSKAFWDDRFGNDWAPYGGPEQTAFFARLFLDRAPSWFSALEGRSLLDVGCATGQATEELRRGLSVAEAYGVDISESAIETAARGFAECRFSGADLVRDSLPVVDVVYCSNVLQLVEEQDLPLALTALVTAARLAVVVLVPFSEKRLEGRHRSRFERGTLPFAHQGARLAFARVVDSSALSESQWMGEQLIAIYVKAGVETPETSVAAADLWADPTESRKRRSDIHSLRSQLRRQSAELASLRSELGATQVELARASREKREQAWKFESRTLGFRVKGAVHRALDAIQSATPEGVRRAVRGVYLPIYRTVFPEGPTAPAPSAPVEHAAAADRPDPGRAGFPLPESGAPLVSVVLPVYNQAGLLGEAVLSVLGQSYRRLELIVVDDGSSDDIEPVLASFAEDRRVKILRRTHQGLPQALNAGFREAQGELWTWTSADNLLHADALDVLVEFLRRHPDVDMTYANMDLIDSVGRPLEDAAGWAGFQNPDAPSELLLPREVEPLGLVEQNFIGACFLYRADAARLVGDYDESIEGAEDYDYWLRMSELGSIRHVGIDRPLHHYRLHPESLTESRYDEIREKCQALVRRHRERSGKQDPLAVCLKARSVRHRLPEDLEIEGSMMLYIGPTASDIVDWGALEETADANPWATLLIVSTDGAAIPEGVRRANVRAIGPKPVEEWPPYLANADLLLAPFAEASLDTFLAYLCAGKPVLATPAARELGMHAAANVWIAEPGEFAPLSRQLPDIPIDLEAVDAFLAKRSVIGRGGSRS